MADQQTLTIEITTGHCLGGVGNDVYPGDVLEAPRDLSIEEARKKVRLGYARVIETNESAPTIVTQNPVVESRDPEIETPIRRRGRPRAGGR